MTADAAMVRTVTRFTYTACSGTDALQGMAVSDHVPSQYQSLDVQPDAAQHIDHTMLLTWEADGWLKARQAHAAALT